MGKILSITMLALIIVGTLTIGFNVKPAKAEWTGTVYIHADGSIDPPDAPIITRDNVTYTLTGNIKSSEDGIVVKRDNIVIDGAGYTVLGTVSPVDAYLSKGIFLFDGRCNVTIKNITIKDFEIGIFLYDSSNNIISGNSIITCNDFGIFLYDSSNNIISGNTFVDCGLFVWDSYGNVVVENLVNGKPLVYLEGASDMVVEDAGQVILVNCNRMKVMNLDLSNTTTGMQLWKTNNTVITQNIVTANDWYGIWLKDSFNNSVSENYIADNKWFGIILHESFNNIISGNMFINDGLGVLDSYGNLVMDNLVNGKPLVYLENVLDFKVEDAGQVILIKCVGIVLENLNLTHTKIAMQLWKTNNTKITDNNIANNLVGILLEDSSNNSICRNSITANDWYGIWLKDSFNNSVSENYIADNKWFGIILEFSNYNSIYGNNVTANNHVGVGFEGSSNNSISGNNIANNMYGIAFYYSSNNRLWHNNIIDNAQQVFSDGYANTWDDGYPSGGNYWSDYTGVDLYNGPYQNETGSDGIGDTPYIIDAYNIDRYPLMIPYGAPLLPTYSLIITATAGGTTNPVPGTYTYASGTSVSVTAIPEEYYVFDHWELDTVNVGSANPYTVLMDKNHTLKAVFAYSPPPITFIFNVTWEGVSYPVVVESNSTVSNFTFNQPQARISFNVTGTVGTHGYCNITIPISLLGGPYTVSFDGSIILEGYDAPTNGTHAYIYFTYTHSQHRIEITGTTVIPEFPLTTIIPPLTLMAITLAILRRKGLCL